MQAGKCCYMQRFSLPGCVIARRLTLQRFPPSVAFITAGGLRLATKACSFVCEHIQGGVHDISVVWFIMGI